MIQKREGLLNIYAGMSAAESTAAEGNTSRAAWGGRASDTMPVIVFGTNRSVLNAWGTDSAVTR